MADNVLIQQVGTTAAPIALSVTGGATKIWTWTHNHGAKPVKIEILEAAGLQVISSPVASIAAEQFLVTQTSVNAFAIRNQSAATVASIILLVWWKIPSQSLGASVAASVGVLS